MRSFYSILPNSWYSDFMIIIKSSRMLTTTIQTCYCCLLLYASSDLPSNYALNEPGILENITNVSDFSNFWIRNEGHPKLQWVEDQPGSLSYRFSDLANPQLNLHCPSDNQNDHAAISELVDADRQDSFHLGGAE